MLSCGLALASSLSESECRFLDLRASVAVCPTHRREHTINLTELLPAGGIDALAVQLGIPPEQAKRGAEALLPSVLGGMSAKSESLDSQASVLGGVDLAHNVVGSEPTKVD